MDGGPVDDEDGGGETTAGEGGASGEGAAGEAGSSGAGAGAGEGGEGGEPATDPPPSGCDGLAECCADLSVPERMNCMVIATNADDMTCDQLVPLYCVPDGGGDDSCDMLAACCETLDRGPVRVACASAAMTGMALQCEQARIAFCSGSGVEPNACRMLASCCGTLPAEQRRLCTTIVQQGQLLNCQTAEPLFCP
jgi:hypothetical protein